MPTDPQLEQYLSALDKNLGQVPVSDRSEIITEIKSHVLEAKERDPDQSMNKLLASLGEPEGVANRYLIERGLKPGRPSKTPIVKWLTIGFLGTFGITALFIIILFTHFSPLISVDDKAGRVMILGGLIDIKDGDVNIQTGRYSQNQESSQEINPAVIKQILISFDNGKIEVAPSADSKMHWSCKMSSKEPMSQASEKGVFSLNLGKTGGSANCDIQVPGKTPLLIEGRNAKLSLSKPQGDVELKLNNGSVSVTPDPQKNYHYDMHVTRGVVQGLESSDAKDAIQIKMTMENGKISRD